jgi:hypothetical protein
MGKTTETAAFTAMHSRALPAKQPQHQRLTQVSRDITMIEVSKSAYLLRLEVQHVKITVLSEQLASTSSANKNSIFTHGCIIGRTLNNGDTVNAKTQQA